MSIYAGVFSCSLFGDVIWFDTNGNNRQDPSENGINGIRVEIFKMTSASSWVKVEETFSGHRPGTPSDDGYWKVCLPPGEYYVQFNMPPVFSPVVPFVGGQAIDSDVTEAFGPNTTNSIVLESCTMNCDIDGGFRLANGSVVINDDGNNLTLSEDEFYAEGSHENSHNLINWSVNSGITDVSHFQIDKVMDDGTLEKIAAVLFSDLDTEYNFRDYNVLKSDTYKYLVSEISHADVKLDSREVEVVVDIQEWDMKIYPNPVIDILNIEIGLSNSVEQISISLFNSSGSKVDGMGIIDVDVNSSILKYDIDVSYLSPGIYYVQTTIGSKSELKKIVVVN